MKLISSFLLTNYFFFSKIIAFLIGHQYFRLNFKLARIKQQKKKSPLVYMMICFLFFFNFLIMSFMLKFRIISSILFNLLDMCALVFGHRSNVIGLTGGIGCGKSTVCEILKKYKAIVIDADKISKSVRFCSVHFFFSSINLTIGNLKSLSDKQNKKNIWLISSDH